MWGDIPATNRGIDMKPTIAIVVIVGVMVVMSWGGYVLGQRGAAVEVTVGMSDMASAMAKFTSRANDEEGMAFREVLTDEFYGLILRYHECWPKMKLNDIVYTEKEKVVVTMYGVTGLWNSFETALEKTVEMVEHCESNVTDD